MSGGLNGGTAPAFLALCHTLARRTDDDLADGVIALWHDESQLNRYVAELDPAEYRLLTPAYWYPEGWHIPFEPKITVRDKSKWIDMTAVKAKSRNWALWPASGMLSARTTCPLSWPYGTPCCSNICPGTRPDITPDIHAPKGGLSCRQPNDISAPSTFLRRC